MERSDKEWEWIERTSLVEFALIHSHISIDEAGLHFAEVIREIKSSGKIEVQKAREEERKKIGGWLEQQIYGAELNLEIRDMNMLYGLVEALKRGEEVK